MIKVYLAYATVLEVVDGDTIHADLDVGWGICLRSRKQHGIGTVRILYADGSAYDAPERSTEAGKAAATYARSLVRPGTQVRITSYHLDDFGRTLGAATLPDGRDWASVMSSEGHVKR